MPDLIQSLMQQFIGPKKKDMQPQKTPQQPSQQTPESAAFIPNTTQGQNTVNRQAPTSSKHPKSPCVQSWDPPVVIVTAMLRYAYRLTYYRYQIRLLRELKMTNLSICSFQVDQKLITNGISSELQMYRLD